MSSETGKGNRKRITIADVARHAGVSTATVSRVINETAYVRPQIVARVRSAVSALNFRPHAAAQILATQRTNTIGLLLSEISNEFFAPLLRGIEEAARSSGYRLLISTHGNDLGPADAPLSLGEHNTDGILAFVNCVPDKELARFEQLGFPVVLVHRTPPDGLSVPSVTVENKRGARILVDHLIETHGLKRIGFLTGEIGHEDSYWRELGYKESLAAHDIAFDPDLLAAGGFNRHQAQTTIESWLIDGLEFDAVFAGDDEAAIGVMNALTSAGLKVPEDIAVVGFDDIYIAKYLNPPLTTVRAPTEQVGSEAIKQLVSRIRGDEVEPVLLLPTTLIIRQSCGCR